MAGPGQNPLQLLPPGSRKGCQRRGAHRAGGGKAPAGEIRPRTTDKRPLGLVSDDHSLLRLLYQEKRPGKTDSGNRRQNLRTPAAMERHFPRLPRKAPRRGICARGRAGEIPGQELHRGLYRLGARTENLHVSLPPERPSCRHHPQSRTACPGGARGGNIRGDRDRRNGRILSVDSGNQGKRLSRFAGALAAHGGFLHG